EMAIMVPAEILLAIDTLGAAAATPHERQHGKAVVAQPVRLGRKRPGAQLITADIGAVGEDRERRRARSRWWVVGRLHPDRPAAIGRAKGEMRDPDPLARPG